MNVLRRIAMGIDGTVAIALPLAIPGTVRALRGGVITVPVLADQAATAQDPGCKVLFSALDKTIITPSHSYVTQTDSGKGTPDNGEQIFAGGNRYIKLTGKWMKSPLTTQELQEQDRQNRQNAKEYSYRYMRDESVQGESAAVYHAHNKTEDFTSDAEIWISKTKGLILRAEEDMDTGGEGGKRHLSTRYEYSNVQAPVVSQ